MTTTSTSPLDALCAISDALPGGCADPAGTLRRIAAICRHAGAERLCNCSEPTPGEFPGRCLNCGYQLPARPAAGDGWIALTAAGRYEAEVGGGRLADCADYPVALAMLAGAVRASGRDPACWYTEEVTGRMVRFPVPPAEVGVDWHRPATAAVRRWFGEGYDAGAVGFEAVCLLCGEPFRPYGPDDMTHHRRVADGEPCGGPGAPSGWWGGACGPGSYRPEGRYVIPVICDVDPLNEPYLRVVRRKTIGEVAGELAEFLGPRPRGAEEGGLTVPFWVDQARDWPKGGVACYAAAEAGGGEGHLVQVEVITDPGPGREQRTAELIMVGKTADGAQAAWYLAYRVAQLLGVLTVRAARVS
jgi:hypothetical protein